MTAKRFITMTNHYGASRTYCTGIYDNQDNYELTNSRQVIDKLNALHEDLETHKQYCKTLGIGINKIMQSIKDDREEKALVMCLTLLKKLEEEDLLE